ncbi:MAG: hypothetical protein QM831_06980 [Kofleriaceae bacterium]
MNKLFLICGVLALVGCTKADSGDDGNGSDQYVDGFNPPPVADGYTRYITAPMEMQPGEDKIFCQWLQVPATDDVDVVGIGGYQTVTGHHVVLYSTSETQPVGENHECTTDDMVSVNYLGGLGQEGGSSTVLPNGYVFRQQKGRSLMANVHYLNATDSVQKVQSVIDLKLAPPSPDLKPAGMAVINYLDFTIPASTPSYTTDAYCTWPQDTSLMMWSNHEHEYGTSVYSEVIHTDGTKDMLVADTQWRAEEAFNPEWAMWDAAPRLIKAGETMHVSCTWNNTRTTPITFPDEMCDAVGFYQESGQQIVCDGQPRQ